MNTQDKLGGIGWCHVSSNPIKYRHRETGKTVHFCIKISDGCKYCYARAIAMRFGGVDFTAPNLKLVEPYLDEKELRRWLTSKKLAGKRVFVGDMTDIFGEWVPDSFLIQVFLAMSRRRDVTFQLLTKRPDRMLSFLQNPGGHVRPGECAHGLILPNVWLGFSAENQECFEARWSHMRQLAKQGWLVFCSYEPALETIDFHQSLSEGLRWVIVGGESGPNARPFNLRWAHSAITQCRDARVAVFFKQAGSHLLSGQDGLLDHVHFRGNPSLEPAAIGKDGERLYRIHLKDKKGADPSEWPVGMCIQEFPSWN